MEVVFVVLLHSDRFYVIIRTSIALWKSCIIRDHCVSTVVIRSVVLKKEVGGWSLDAERVRDHMKFAKINLTLNQRLQTL